MAFSTINVCILCEAVRPELGGKNILLGYYGIAPYVRIQIQNFAQPTMLVFAFAGGPGHGHFRIDLRITAPNGATFDAQGFEGDLRPQASYTNIFMAFQGVLPGPGNYTAALLVNGAVQFQAPFALDPAPAPAAPGLPPLPQHHPN
jgi:hypothetical protein